MWRPPRTRRFGPTPQFLILTTALVMAAPAGRATGQSLPTSPVVLSGQPAADTSGARYAYLGPAAIDDSGRVRFDATLVGTGVTAADDSAAFVGPALGGPGGMRLLAREGQPAPGIAGSVLGELSGGPMPIAPDGQSLVWSTLRTPGAPDGRAYFAGTPGDLRLVYQPSPTEVVHGHALINAGPRAVLWTQGRSLVYWDGSATTQVPTPGEYFQPTINGAGRIGFTAYNTDTEKQMPGLYAGSAGDFRPVAVRGQAAPGLPAGYAFDMVLDASQNDAGQFAFLGPVRSEEPESYTWGLWAGRPGELRLLARDGQSAPGLPPGLRLERVLWDIDSPTTPPIGAAGHVPFWAAIEDEGGAFQGTGAWLALPDGSLRYLARSGDVVTAPLPGGGSTQLELGEIDDNAMWVNGAGQVVLMAGDSNGRRSFFAAGADGALRLIASPDVPFEVAPGDVRTISDIVAGFGRGTGGEDGRPSPFNDAGQFVYRLNFSDGTTGIFLTTVPEPGAAGAWVLAAGALLCRRRRRSAGGA